MKCTLVADINKCQYFNKEIQGCNNDGKCSFQSKDEEKNVTGYKKVTVRVIGIVPIKCSWI